MKRQFALVLTLAVFLSSCSSGGGTAVSLEPVPTIMDASAISLSPVAPSSPTPGPTEDTEETLRSSLSEQAAVDDAAVTPNSTAPTSAAPASPAPTPTPVPTQAPTQAPTPVPTQAAAQEAVEYVLNTNTKRFHYPSCKSVKTIKPENYSTSSLSRNELIGSGYKACGNCKP